MLIAVLAGQLALSLAECGMARMQPMKMPPSWSAHYYTGSPRHGERAGMGTRGARRQRLPSDRPHPTSCCSPPAIREVSSTAYPFAAF